ncbi:MAG TPA: MFS transporter [Candidatus Limnocylindrales bacterium]|nr:MFS transporter [Candidatus Limnocylindrales bacterium]
MSVLARDARGRAIHPDLTLWLLSIAHAVNHAQAVVIPLIYLQIISEFHVTAAQVAELTAIGAFASGLVQLSYAKLTRVVSRRSLLTAGGVVFGSGFAAQAATSAFVPFAAVNIASRIGGSQQHPVGNGLLAEQFPEQRRGFAISAHISGGNVGTVIVVALIGIGFLGQLDWRAMSLLFGVPAVVVALAILVFVRETGSDREAAKAHGSVANAFRTVLRDPDHRWTYLTSVLGGGGRGLGVVNLFVLLYLTSVLHLPTSTTDPMYAVLILLSVPMPLVAGWLSDRVGRRPVIIGVYVGGALAFAVFLLVGSSIAGLWIAIVLLGLFTFAESPQLQALLADIAAPPIRDASFSLYFTLAFGVGSTWTFLYGLLIDPSALGVEGGLPWIFILMAVAFVAAALSVIPIREPATHRDAPLLD